MLKRVVAIIIFIISVFAVWKGNFPLITYGSDAVERVLYRDNSSGVVTSSDILSLIACCKGESCFFTQKINPQWLESQLGGKILFEESTEYGTSYYGFSPVISYRTEIYGKEINFHLFVAQDYSKIGFPIIFGSY